MAIEIAQIDGIPIYTSAHLLTALNKAIIDVSTSGQSYSINGRTFNRANLADLKRIRDDIKAEVDAAASSSGRNAALGDFSNQ